ncbi:response regulator receiver sensor signal transduction histidine kinase [Candidatus Magnetomorum sp. HK-1]|nr:response regulator receiver sensor signal transduction histidine kinase [Candidatus Magnetomorum sp. HK-1]
MSDQQKRKPTILIVDDNFINLNILLEFLNQKGYKTLIAQDGETAIRRAEIGLPDLILLDIMMAGIDGFETCKRLKKNERTRHIPVIFLTALTDTANQMKGFEVGGVDYITKPFDHVEVLSCIRKQIKIKKQNEELTQLTPSISEDTEARDRFFSIIVHKMSKAFNQLHDLSSFFAEAITELHMDEIDVFDRHLFGSARNTINNLENILNWGRVQNKDFKVKSEKLDMYGLCMAVLYRFQKLAQSKNISISHDIKPQTNVLSDSDMTYRVLCNLLFLVIEHAVSQTITISIEHADQKVYVYIKDTSLSPDLLNNLGDSKDILETIDSNESIPISFTLALCQKMLEKNNGSLLIKQTDEKNASICMVLPAGE